MDFSLGLAFDRFVVDQLTRRRRATNRAWQFIKKVLIFISLNRLACYQNIFHTNVSRFFFPKYQNSSVCIEMHQV